MPAQSNVQLALSEKLDFALGTLGLLRTICFAAIGYPFSSSSKTQPGLGREVLRRILRFALDRFSIAQLQWALPSSTATYREWIKTRAAAEGTLAEELTEDIGDGAKLHWIGRKDAKKVILHFHGGGYVLPMSLGHLTFNNYVRREIKRRSGVEVKLAFLEYTLLPSSKYPTQFRQAVSAVRHVLASGISPADIVISGDSAGGQLAFQVISHILHPHPSISPLPIPAVPFAGIFALSPWVIYDSDAPSFVNNDKDFISSKPLIAWGRMIREGTPIADNATEPGGHWGELLKAPPEWWHECVRVTPHFLIAYGDWEGFRDDDRAFVKKFKEGVSGTHVDVKSVEEPKGLHISPSIDAFAGRAPSEFSKIISGWIHDRLTY